MSSPLRMKGKQMIACGLDFGTSNSAIGVARDAAVALAPLEGSNTLMPSAVFFDYETKGRVLFGTDAISAYVGQTEGRLMRALKSILGSSLLDEKTSLGGREVLANAGVRLGGTDFDSALNLATVMPLLGLGTHLIEKNLPMPNGLYHELATWATINFAYSHKKERELAELLSDAREPEKVGRLLKVVRQRLGHRLAFVVEDAKIALSGEDRAALSLAFVDN